VNNEIATKADLQVIVAKSLGDAVHDISKTMVTLAQSTNGHLEAIRREHHELAINVHKLADTIAGYSARIDSYEAERLSAQTQHQNLLDWARRVSVKTGIPIDKL
jgi:hypothetical protein